MTGSMNAERPKHPSPSLAFRANLCCGKGQVHDRRVPTTIASSSARQGQRSWGGVQRAGPTSRVVYRLNPPYLLQRVWCGLLLQAFDSVRYAAGQTNELKGTGVFSFIKATRAQTADQALKAKTAAPKKPPPQK